VSWYHDDMMSGYYAAREAQEREAEALTLGYDAELADYFRDHPRITFRSWLIEWNRREKEAA
jgi:hypothetical protein